MCRTPTKPWLLAGVYYECPWYPMNTSISYEWGKGYTYVGYFATISPSYHIFVTIDIAEQERYVFSIGSPLNAMKDHYKPSLNTTNHYWTLLTAMKKPLRSPYFAAPFPRCLGRILPSTLTTLVPSIPPGWSAAMRSSAAKWTKWIGGFFSHGGTPSHHPF